MLDGYRLGNSEGHRGDARRPEQPRISESTARSGSGSGTYRALNSQDGERLKKAKEVEAGEVKRT